MGVYGSIFQACEWIVVDRQLGTVKAFVVDEGVKEYNQRHPRISAGSVSWDEIWGTRILTSRQISVKDGK